VFSCELIKGNYTALDCKENVSRLLGLIGGSGGHKGVIEGHRGKVATLYSLFVVNTTLILRPS